jgi:hypothetical protein
MKTARPIYMQNDEEEKYNEVLASFGLSQEKIDYIRRVNSDKKTFQLYLKRFTASFVLGIIFLIGCLFIVVVGYLFIVAHGILFDYLIIKQRTQGIDYIFYDSVWMTHLIPMLLLGILLPGWLISKLRDYFPKTRVLDFTKSLDNMAYRSVKDHDVFGVLKFSRWYTRKLMDNNFHSLPIEQGLDYLGRKTRKWISLCMLLFIVIALPLLVLDVLNYKLVTKEGVIERDYASLQTTKKTWNDVTKVETGCYFTEKDKTLTLKYTVAFNDGSKIDLFEAKAKDDTITGIKAVDTLLRQLDKPISIGITWRGAHSSDPFINDACFPKLREQYPAQYSEIIKLLRLEKYSANQ